MYLEHSINRLALNDKRTLIVHIEQCEGNFSIDSCQLNDYRKRLVFIATNPIFVKSFSDHHLCLLKCSFELSSMDNFHQLSFHRPLHLDLSIQFTNKTSMIIPRTHVSLYHCERLALNCTSCVQLDPSYGCIWCNNMCMWQKSNKSGDMYKSSGMFITSVLKLLNHSYCQSMVEL